MSNFRMPWILATYISADLNSTLDLPWSRCVTASAHNNIDTSHAIKYLKYI